MGDPYFRHDEAQDLVLCRQCKVPLEDYMKLTLQNSPFHLPTI